MAKLEMHGEHAELLFAEGHPPDYESVKGAWPHRPPIIRDARPEFRSYDEALATTLTARTRMNIYHRRHLAFPDDPDRSLTWPLDTWVLGLPEERNAKFTGWFDGMDCNYRVMIHLTPLVRPGHRSMDDPSQFWSSMYVTGAKTRKLWVKTRQVSRDLRATTKPFLADLLEAYKDGTQAVEGLLAESGHGYTHGQIIIPKENNSNQRNQTE